MSRKYALTGAIVVVLLFIGWRVLGGDAKKTGAGDEAGAAEQASSDGPSAERALPPSRFGVPRTAPSETAATITGTVRDAQTKEAVPWVDVIFEKNRQEAASSSDESGRYEIELAPGSYRVRAVGDGVIARQMAPLRVGLTQKQSLDVEVVRLATLRGKVVSPQGFGLGDVDIVVRADTAAGKAFPNRGEIGVTVSESDGSFAMSVPPGVVDLEATLDETRVFVSAPALESGSVVDDFKIVIDRRGVIEGTARLPDGAAAAGAEVLLSYRRTGTSQFDTRRLLVDESARFRFAELHPGEYVVDALLPGYGAASPQRPTITSEELEQRIEVSLNKSATLSGTVVDAEGNPVGDVQVAQSRPKSKVPYEKQNTYADGKFEFTDMGPGPHWLRARKEGYADSTIDGLMAPKSEIKLVLTLPGGVEGKVVDADGAPMTDFSVQVSARRKKSHSLAGGGKDGTFQIYPIDPGRYKVVISSPGALSSEREIDVPSGAYADVSVSLSSE